MSLLDINLIPTVDVNMMSTVDVTKTFTFDLWLMVSWCQVLTSFLCQFNICCPLGSFYIRPLSPWSVLGLWKCLLSNIVNIAWTQCGLGSKSSVQLLLVMLAGGLRHILGLLLAGRFTWLTGVMIGWKVGVLMLSLLLVLCSTSSSKFNLCCHWEHDERYH